MSLAQPLPGSPARPESDANRHSHPYPIRTTSSSLLTRSNSTGSRHRPSIITSATPTSPALGKAQGRGHKYSKSANSIAPPPLPAPASPAKQDLAEIHGASPARWRLKRSETLPSFFARGENTKEGVPPNPKLWSSRHLAEYLSVALRPRNGGTLPLPVIRDVTGFVVDAKLTGRAFLRLTQEDLDGMGINQLWKESLLAASRTLRQNLVQGRIWGFGNTVMEEDDDIQIAQSPFSPNSGDKSDGSELGSSVVHDRGRNGRVKNMVASLENHANSADEGGMSSSDIDDSSNDDSGEAPLSSGGPTSEDDNSGYVSAEQYHSSTSDNNESRATTEDVAAISNEAKTMTTAISASNISLLQTPPPVYAASVALEDTPMASEDRIPKLLLSISKASPDDPSHAKAIVELSLEQHHANDSPEPDETMANLIANLQEPKSGPLGANAWEQAAELEAGSTSRRITEAIENGAAPVGKSAHPRSVIGLFETPPPLPLPPQAETESSTAAAEPAEAPTANLVSVPGASQHTALLAELVQRLEEVERRLDQAEARQSEWETREQELIELRRIIQEERQNATNIPSTMAIVDLVSPPPFDKSGVAAHRKCTHHDASVDAVQDTVPTHDKGTLDEPSASGLPGYVLLVGLGVFTVVARVVFKRLTGRRAY